MKTKILNTLLVISFMAMTIFGCGTTHVNAYEVRNNKTTVTVMAVTNKNILKEPKIKIISLKEKIKEERKKSLDKVKRGTKEKKKVKNNTIQEKIKISCEFYEVDYDIALAIARLETGHFKSYAYLVGNNPGGLSKNEKPMKFASKDEGVDRFIKNLKIGYFDKGLDTPEKIGKKYCPVNPNWANLVEQIMEMD